MKPSLLIVEDCEATRFRLEKAITQDDRFELVGSVGEFKLAVKELTTKQPDILLTDLDLPDGNGVELIKMLGLATINTKLAIVISIFGDGPHVIDAIKAGASGYLLKDDDYLDINNAISQMLEGGAPISPCIAQHLLTELKVNEPTPSKAQTIEITDREREVLVLVSKGYSSKEIADILGLSYHTITHF
jgi:DNA-binding NarL/FixJ family response regulator